MSGIDYVHHQAFPSLISTFELKDHPCEKTVLEMIETWEKTGNHRLVHEGSSSYITGDEQFLNDKRLIDLWKTIQECCDIYTQEMGIDYTLISTSWFNTLYENGVVDAHRHERSVISGAYYPYVDDGSSPLLFDNPYSQNFMNMNTINLSNYNRYQLECFPKSGLLVIFPSWMKHSVPNNPTKKRFTISFNTIRHADREYYLTLRDYRMQKHESDDAK
jgi:uncharacterized protein (TIGR02466 family)|tara:strand:+ start:3347 stop:4000 length:654 start_codon:yes stop_codon:yes gene_type:complete